MSSNDDAERALAADVAALQSKYAWGVNSGVMSAPCQVLVNGKPCGRRFNEGGDRDGDHGTHQYSPVAARSVAKPPSDFYAAEPEPNRFGIIPATYDEPTLKSIEASERPRIHVDEAEHNRMLRQHVDELLDFANEQKQRADEAVKAEPKPWWRFW